MIWPECQVRRWLSEWLSVQLLTGLWKLPSPWTNLSPWPTRSEQWRATAEAVHTAVDIQSAGMKAGLSLQAVASFGVSEIPST